MASYGKHEKADARLLPYHVTSYGMHEVAEATLNPGRVSAYGTGAGKGLPGHRAPHLVRTHAQAAKDRPALRSGQHVGY